MVLNVGINVNFMELHYNKTIANLLIKTDVQCESDAFTLDYITFYLLLENSLVFTFCNFFYHL